AIESITRIANTTSFAGLKLLNGSLDYRTSGISTSAFSSVKIYNAQFGTRTSIPVNLEVLNSAEKASLFISAGGTLFTGVNTTITVQGNTGVEDITINSQTSVSDLVNAINQTSDATGVIAELYNSANAASGIVLKSDAYGSDAFVKVDYAKDSNFKTYEAKDASGAAEVEKNNDTGVDVMAVVNGILALGDGLDVTLRSSTLNLRMTLTEDLANLTNVTKSFTITGGGALYQIGSSVNSQQQVSLGIGSVAASRLGDGVVGYLSSLRTGGANALATENFTEGSDILDAAIDQITTTRGRLGAFERNTLQTAIRSQGIAMENLSSAQSQIRDADFAEETAKLSRSQILVSAGTSVLALANSSAQQVLQLLQ
ncbi:MAG: hypothetical protein IT442_00780, partial [Phycisphaeraceae bacterium]|nr:hypothetical protein [Phycisphaeraceae bacterium]